MTDHDRGACPRCGGPAFEYSFCEPCRRQLDLTAARELSRVEVAASGADGESITTGASAVQVEPDERTLPAHVSEPPHVPQEVARLEDVLRIAPPPAAPVEPPAALVEPPPRREIDWESLRREVARLEEVLREVDPREDAPTPQPEYVDAQTLREAFWFEQASASQPPPSQPPPSQAPEVQVEPTPLEHDVQPPQRHWATALCLLALIGLIVALTGRRSKRCQ